MSSNAIRFWPLLLVAAASLVGCAAPYQMRLPDSPQARQTYPDQDAYRHFRADAGPAAVKPASTVTL